MVLFWFLRQGFALAVLNNATYKTLYGAMAVIPVFLIWMYLSWAVVIFGAVVTAALDEFRQFNGREIKRQSLPANPAGADFRHISRTNPPPFFRPFKRQNPAKRGVFVLVVSFKVTPFAAFPEFRRIPHTCRNNSGSGKGRCCPAALPPPLCPAS